MTYISPSKVFAHMDRLQAWRSGGAAPPITLEWDLSNRCVLGCQDCHFAHTHTRGPWVSRDRRLPMAYEDTGDLANYALVSRALGEVARAGVRGIVWSGGGEPSTHPAFAEILRTAASYGLAQGLYTLGGLLTRDLADTIKREATWVVVSLDATTAETYADEKGVSPDRYDAAVCGIRRLTGGRAVVGVSYLLHARNWRQAPAMAQQARELGASYVTLRPAIRTAPDRPGERIDDRQWITSACKALEPLAADPFVEVDVARFVAYREWQTHGYQDCHGIKLTATVTPDGRVWVCPQRRGVAGSCLGDLRVESFETIWARHPRSWTVDAGCRQMCRLHLVNQSLVPVFRAQHHEVFV